jgi:putative flippase GtrA
MRAQSETIAMLSRPATEPAVLDVVIPVYNEQVDLADCVRRLHGYLRATFPYSFRITIADNASTDATPAIAAGLAEDLTGVTAVRFEEKGRGRALHAVWSASEAPVLAYMDVDLSTDLAALLPLVAPLISGHSDLAIGTRLSHGSRVERGMKREVISRCYNLLLHGALSARFSDAQCGFKAIRRDVAEQLLPLVQDKAWFFDTELLVLAQRAGLRIHEVPVDWIDDPDSRVDLMATAIADLKGVWRLGRALATGSVPIGRLRSDLGRADVPGVPVGLGRQLARFILVGILSTAAYLLLYALLRNGVDQQVANLIALLVTAVANTAVNRRVTFGIRGGATVVRHQLQGLVIFGIGLGLTSGSLALLGWSDPAASRLTEVAVLVIANLIATVIRFVLFRSWLARPLERPNRATITALRTGEVLPLDLGAAAVRMVEDDALG